ncbi:FAD:protein FMN transferase [Reinekea forsetii]|nr:FAD:protein FMN transferase [Reinekea forsetii]
MRKHVLFTVFKAYLLVGFLSACSFTEKNEIQSLYGYSMGTSYHIKIVSSLSKSQRLQLGIEGILSDINARMSTYLPSSDLSKFKAIEIGEVLDVSSRTAAVVTRALEVSKATHGYFDPTIAPLVDLWGFGPSPDVSEEPSAFEIGQRLPLVGYDNVKVISSQALSKTAASELDLSAIAKGYAVDLVAEYLLEEGIEQFLVEIGGEMRSAGVKPNDEAWLIAIETPTDGLREVFDVLPLTDMAIATSGDYRNYFETNGVRYSHTINPKTGYPVSHNLASTSVIMRQCMDADAYATAFMAMGLEKALEIANEQNIAAYFIYRKEKAFKVAASDSFIRLFGPLAVN